MPTQLGLHFWPSFSYISGIRIDYLSPTLYFTDILVVLLFLFFLINNIKLINNYKPTVKKNLPYFLFLIYLFVVSLVSVEKEISFYGFIKFVEFSFFAFYTSSNFRKIKKYFVFSLAGAMILQSFIAIFQFVNKGSIGGFFYFLGERFFNSQTPNIANASISGELILRPYGTLPHPNVLSAFLLIGIVILIFYLKPGKRINLLILFTVLVSSVVILLSLSRINIFLLFFSFLYIFFLLVQKGKLRKEIAFLSILLLLAIIVFLFNFGTRFSHFFDESFFQRADLIFPTLQMIRDNIFFGVGINNFLTELPGYFKPSGLFAFQPVHNIFLLTASQIGLLGFFFVSSFFIRTFLKSNKFSILLLIIVLISGMFDHYYLTLQQGQLLLSMTIGLIWANYGKEWL
ncbi:MAG: O-antigen ligase family protein [Candidatus Levybacteria bacterium]|nr:O-antigen ligase family protein [Candidatus Levybacteria bacterium]